MTGRVDFLDLFDIDKQLLYTDDGGSIAFTEDESVFARVFVKNDGTVVLQAGTDLPSPPTDYRITFKH